MSKAISSSAVKEALIALFLPPVLTRIHNTRSPFFQYCHPFGYFPQFHALVGMLKSPSHILKVVDPVVTNMRWYISRPLATLLVL